MAFTLISSYNGRNYFTALSTDTKDIADAVPNDICFETDTNKTWEFNGSSWLVIRSPDSAGNSGLNVVIDGLSNNSVRVVAGATYNATLTLGFRVLLKGTGTLTFTPNTSGATAIVVTAAELTAMGAAAYNDWPVAASTITAGTGMQLLVYIP